MIKKITLVLITFFVFALSINAERYNNYKVQDCIIYFDDAEWTVVTRDSASKDFKAGMEENDEYIYASGLLFNNPLEMRVIISEVGKVPNLHILERDEIQKLMDKIDANAEKTGSVPTNMISNATLFEATNYKYTVTDYSLNNKSVREFVTIINGNMYTFRFYRDGNFNYLDNDRILKVMKKMDFDLKAYYENIKNFRSTTKIIIACLAGLLIMAGVCTYLRSNNITRIEKIIKEKDDIKEEKITIKEDEEEKPEEEKESLHEKEREKRFIKYNIEEIMEEEAEKDDKKDSDKVEKKNKKEENIEDSKHKGLFKCEKCGALINGSAKSCPRCGEKFEEEIEEETEEDEIPEIEIPDIVEIEEPKDDLDRKYSDLLKLKELLDKKILTKEEFDKEKKKILNK